MANTSDREVTPTTHEPPEENRLYLSDVAQRLMLSVRSVQRLVQEGKLTPLRHGAGRLHTVFDVSTVDEYWRRQRTLAAKERRRKEREAGGK